VAWHTVAQRGLDTAILTNERRWIRSCSLSTLTTFGLNRACVSRDSPEGTAICLLGLPWRAFLCQQITGKCYQGTLMPNSSARHSRRS